MPFIVLFAVDLAPLVQTYLVVSVKELVLRSMMPTVFSTADQPAAKRARIEPAHSAERCEGPQREKKKKGGGGGMFGREQKSENMVFGESF